MIHAGKVRNGNPQINVPASRIMQQRPTRE
jgi:hypothetical protein